MNKCNQIKEKKTKKVLSCRKSIQKFRAQLSLSILHRLLFELLLAARAHLGGQCFCAGGCHMVTDACLNASYLASHSVDVLANMRSAFNSDIFARIARLSYYYRYISRKTHHW